MKIKSIKAKEILDSRGNPTVQVELETNKGKFLGAVPSGASTGKHEAVELRDKDGKGIKGALLNAKKISKELSGKEFNSQKDFDDLLIALDGTNNKSKLGVNSILPVSIAICRALAAEKKVPLFKYIREIFGYSGKTNNYPLPKPCFNTSMTLCSGKVTMASKSDTANKDTNAFSRTTEVSRMISTMLTMTRTEMVMILIIIDSK